MGKNRITVQCTINSDIDKVWESWTKPDHIINWNFASDEWCCPTAENDLKPGGKFISRMESKDGSMGFDFGGIYEEVKEKELISYKMQDGRKVDIRFISSGNNVEVVETFDAEGTNADEQQRAGWQSILNNFKNYVESIR
ncbi:MAG: SRPBCC family protein [Chlorobiota bacterium]